MAFSFLSQHKTLARIHGETVIYTKASGAARSGLAIVRRSPLSPMPEAAQAQRPKAYVRVADETAVAGSDVLQIAAGELETSTDTLTFPERRGDTAAAFSIARRVLEEEAPGALVLEMR